MATEIDAFHINDDDSLDRLSDSSMHSSEANPSHYGKKGSTSLNFGGAKSKFIVSTDTREASHPGQKFYDGHKFSYSVSKQCPKLEFSPSSNSDLESSHI
jgi:hypothetical protein